MFITQKTLKKKLQDAYSDGITKGYELGYKMGKAESNHKGFITGSKVDQQLDDILREKL